ncbi:TrkH family potassium uptake protein [Halalkalicoccus ordinarius]|uniref:TrkH family potassium uptake protein n=1 Tax=Halalkalicoccus ordinarius TaxID=3116651 RepID=UPI00300ED935
MWDDARTIGGDLGTLFVLLGGLMAGSTLVAAVWREWYAIPGFLLSAALTAGLGAVLNRWGTDSPDTDPAHGLVTAALAWLFSGVLCGLPILFVAWTVALDPSRFATPELDRTLVVFLSPTNAAFEGMSGVTGTGLTMALDESVLPATIQWWRSLVQWIGGVGVVVLAAAVVLTGESGAFRELYEEKAAVETIGESTEETLRAIWWVFVALTAGSVLALWAAGMPAWQAINHGMTGISTGGFTVTPDGIASYDDPVIEAVLLPVMALGAISFAVHYYALRGDVHALYADRQTRWLLGILGAGVLLVGLFLFAGPFVSPGDAVRFGAFQFVSALTCTGFQTDTALGTVWSLEAQLLLVGAMTVGGASGSTAGGIKVIRFMSLTKGSYYRMTEAFFPDVQRTPQIAEAEGEATVDHSSSEFDQAAAVGLLWIFLLLFGVICLLLVLDLPLEVVLFEVASAQGNVGLSAGPTGPTMPDAAKGILMTNMWIGRLEIIPVAALARALLKGFGADLDEVDVDEDDVGEAEGGEDEDGTEDADAGDGGD